MEYYCITQDYFYWFEAQFLHPLLSQEIPELANGACVKASYLYVSNNFAKKLQMLGRLFTCRLDTQDQLRLWKVSGCLQPPTLQVNRHEYKPPSLVSQNPKATIVEVEIPLTDIGFQTMVEYHSSKQCEQEWKEYEERKWNLIGTSSWPFYVGYFLGDYPRCACEDISRIARFYYDQSDKITEFRAKANFQGNKRKEMFAQKVRAQYQSILQGKSREKANIANKTASCDHE